MKNIFLQTVLCSGLLIHVPIFTSSWAMRSLSRDLAEEILNPLPNHSKIWDLLELGVSPNLYKHYENTSFDEESESDPYDVPLLNLAVCRCDAGTVQLFLDAGAKINELVDSDGSSPLFSAAACGHSNNVRLLLRSGANPNIKNKKGNTPIIVAAMQGHVVVVEELLKADACVDIKNNERVTALDIVEKKIEDIRHAYVARAKSLPKGYPGMTDEAISRINNEFKKYKDIVDLLKAHHKSC